MKRFTDHYRFHMQWHDRQNRDWCEVIALPALEPPVDGLIKPSLLSEARRTHARACEGGWVRDGMFDPHVSALKMVKGGRILPEDLAPKADWCAEHERLRCHCEKERAA
jgi:hypothetical protein